MIKCIVSIQILVDSQKYKTPSETIKGVQSFEMDGVRAGILSIAKDITYAYADDECINEEVSFFCTCTTNVNLFCFFN